MLRHDLSHALRVFRRAPLFYSGILLTLALGIGANGAVFSILRAVLLQPLPYRDAANVVMVWRAPTHPPVGQQNEMLQGRAWMRGYLTPQQVADWRAESKDVLTDVAAMLSWQGNLDVQFDLALGDRALRLRGALVTPNFFDVLGVTAARGRVLTTADEQSSEPVIVISDALWRSAFGADPGIIGRRVTLIAGNPRARGPRAFTVVGVLPPAFRFTYPQETEIWSPVSWSALVREHGGRYGICCQAIARLRDRVSFDTAAARMAAIHTDLENPRVPQVIRLERTYDWVVGETRPSLLLLGAVALLLLAITCATVGNALLVRIAERRHELAVRVSLGADRGRLVRQLLTEGGVLATAGAAAGTLAAALLTPMLRSLMPTVIPRADEIGINAWMLVFGAAAAGLTTIVAAAAPAWHGARVDPGPTLKSASMTASGDRASVRWRQGTVAVQSAVATILLIVSTLLLASFWHLRRVPLGFDGQRVLTVEMDLLGQRYQGKWVSPSTYEAPPAIGAFRRDLVQRVRALPGVLDAGLTSAVPFRGIDYTVVLNAVGETKDVVGNERMVDPGYFSVMRIPLIRGRLFTASDTAASQRVAVVSESYARQMFGNADPIGRRIAHDVPTEVVGVVGDVRYVALDRTAHPAIYLPAAQGSSLLVCLVARLAPNAGDLEPAVRDVVHDLDPALPAMKTTTIDRIVDESVANRRFYTTATTAFAAVALVLTIAGLVVIVSRSVVERRRELAIRSALGATRGRIVRLVVRAGLMPVLVGTAGGSWSAYAASRLLAIFLFQTTPTDPIVYGGAVALVGAAAALAALMPARRAASVAPANVLRAE